METGQQLAIQGAQRAADHADNVFPNWADHALESFRAFCVGKGEPFMTEDVREFAYKHNVPRPPDQRAWGHIAIKAKKLGWIISAGFGKAKDNKVHGSINPIWKSLI